MYTNHKYLHKKFLNTFSNGCNFWTSEDGNWCAIAIIRTENTKERLQTLYKNGIKWDWNKLREGYVQYGWLDMDYFDGGYVKKGKGWTVCEEKTDFPVMIYEDLLG